MFHRSEGQISVFVDQGVNDNFLYAKEGEEPLPEDMIIGNGFISAVIVPQVEDTKPGISMPMGCPIYSQCISLLRENGFQTQGNAKDLKITSKEPCRGCAILMYSGRFGHVGLVLDYNLEEVKFLEKNFLGCGIISTRTLPLNDKSIRGYLVP